MVRQDELVALALLMLDFADTCVYCEANKEHPHVLVNVCQSVNKLQL